MCVYADICVCYDLRQHSECNGLSEMQRLSVTLCGLLASCLCFWGFCANFSVTQTPSAVTLRKGEQVHLTCSWNTNITGVKVKWFKDNQEINQTSKLPETKNIKDCEILVLNNADRDVGFYICEVTMDIPVLSKVNGTGTNVTYYRNNDTDNAQSTDLVYDACPTEHRLNTSQTTQQHQSAPVLETSVSLAVVILFVCVFLTVWRMKISSKQSERMVIREGPPSEEGQPENSEDGGSSRTSRGSTEWYMVPVYESYFDLQRSDEQECVDSDDAACASPVK
ncbi:uncharacterized protein LOC128518349 [Clarias gariepinus]|uniref:uncharacterized protein LOC128518349 n=1 Tax=Clarias gariepinus TaxID=13013 RepID=UPI00234D62BD|nr:uncharacterized protein LOC128518349 [Clarias gariepinus]